jgi:hypothetical protein
MANLSTYAADKLLDHLLGRTAFTMPTVYVALFTTNPTEPAGTGGVEVSATGTAYARLALGTGAGCVMGASASGSSTSGSALNWSQATADWGTITGVGLYDAATGGNLLDSGPLAANKVVSNGDTYSMPAGDLTAALA